MAQNGLSETSARMSAFGVKRTSRETATRFEATRMTIADVSRRLALLGSERGFALNSFGFGRHSAPRFGHHKGIKPKPNDGDAGKRKERRAIACLDNHDSSERGR